MSPLPDEFVDRLGRIVPSDRLPECLGSFACRKPTAFRVNTLKADVDTVACGLRSEDIEFRPVNWLSTAFVVPDDQRRALTETAAARDGLVYIQNLSSMLPSLILNPQPGEIVLDLAAAPGGKTLHMADMMQNTGRLSAVESVKSRFHRLRHNTDFYGASIVKCYMTDGRSVGRKCPDMFERVLLDAPCSSEARFSQLDPTSWFHWSVRKVGEAARKQKRLLRSAIDSLRPGGCIVYCTCSFAPEENEAVVNSQLRHYGDLLDVEPVSLPIPNVHPGLTEWDGKAYDPRLLCGVRILPTAEMDGLFICRLVKQGA